MPEEWVSFKVHYRYKNTMYHIQVSQEESAATNNATTDSVSQPEPVITLIDDGADHEVQIVIRKISKVDQAEIMSIHLPAVNNL